MSLCMKGNVFKFVCAISMMALCSGCKDIVFPIWDFQPEYVSIVVKNSAGENLLDPETEDNILANEITVEYDGMIYQMKEWGAETRYIPAKWEGFFVSMYFGRDPNREEGIRALTLGQFYVDTEAGYHSEPLTINWGDGTSDKITFDLYTTYNRKGTKSEIHRTIWLNGKLQSNNSLDITIVK